MADSLHDLRRTWVCPVHGYLDGGQYGTNMRRPPFEPDKTYCSRGHDREHPQEVTEVWWKRVSDEEAEEIRAVLSRAEGGPE